MHVRTGFVVTIIAAAAGAAAGRATAPRASQPVLTALTARSTTTASSEGSGAGVSTTAGDPSEASRTPRGRSGRAAGNVLANSQTVVYVAGAVVRPGVYALRPTARAEEALRAAGGATPQSDLVAVNLAARVRDGEEIVVPVRGAEASTPSGTGRPAAQHSRRHASKRGHHRKRIPRVDEATDSSDPPTEVVDVNAADEATLGTLPGVGPSLAHRIAAFRDLNGPFASSDELLDVGGMTPGKVDALTPYVTFH